MEMLNYLRMTQRNLENVQYLLTTKRLYDKISVTRVRDELEVAKNNLENMIKGLDKLKNE